MEMEIFFLERELILVDDRGMLHVYRLVLNEGGHGECTVSDVA